MGVSSWKFVRDVRWRDRMPRNISGSGTMIEQSKVERDQDACLAPGSEITVDRRSTEAKSPSPAWPPQVTLLTSSTSIFFFNTHYQAFTDIFCRSQIWHLLQILILLRSSNGYHENITVQTPFILRTKPGPHPKRRYEWHALRNHGSTPHELGVLKASSHLETSPDPWYYPVFLGFRILQSEISPSANLASPIANVTELWTDDYLADNSGDRLISIAVTPNGSGFRCLLSRVCF